MNNNPFITVRNGEVKGFDFSPWGGIEGFLAASQNTTAPIIPDVYHALNMTAIAVSQLPFAVYDSKGYEVDSSASWQNKLGGIDSPQRFLYLIAAALCGGQAYAIKEVTPKMAVNVQYCEPSSIKPHIEADGVQYFERTVNGRVERLSTDEVIYFWLPDRAVEIGPAINHPLAVASSAAQLAYKMSQSLDKMADRGFVPPTLLSVSGVTDRSTLERTETWFNSFIKGAYNKLAKIIQGDRVDIKQLGAGMAELKGSFVELKRESKEDIARAFGIPMGLFLSDAAFASEYNALIRMWYSSSVFNTILQTIQETLTEQLFGLFGYSFAFDLNSLDAFQADEATRSVAVASLVPAIESNPRVARFVMGFLGYDFNEEQEQELEELIKIGKPTEQPTMQKPNREDVDRLGQEDGTRGITLTAPMIKDLKTWQDMCTRFLKKSKPLPIEFECKALPDEVADGIRELLKDAKTEADIQSAFEIRQTPPKVDDAAASLTVQMVREALKFKVRDDAS